MWMFSEPFFGVTTMGAHHSVASVTGAIIFCLSNTSSSVLSLSWYLNGILCGVPMQKGLASAKSDVELFTYHGSNLAIKDTGDFSCRTIQCEWCWG